MRKGLEPRRLALCVVGSALFALLGCASADRRGGSGGEVDGWMARCSNADHGRYGWRGLIQEDHGDAREDADNHNKGYGHAAYVAVAETRSGRELDFDWPIGRMGR